MLAHPMSPPERNPPAHERLHPRQPDAAPKSHREDAPHAQLCWTTLCATALHDGQARLPETPPASQVVASALVPSFRSRFPAWSSRTEAVEHACSTSVKLSVLCDSTAVHLSGTRTVYVHQHAAAKVTGKQRRGAAERRPSRVLGMGPPLLCLADASAFVTAPPLAQERSLRYALVEAHISLASCTTS